MFALRGVAVSLAFFFLLYCALSALVALAWRAVRDTPRLAARNRANLLFVMRMVPAALAAVGTMAFAIPSFWLLEPRGGEEEVGLAPLLLGMSCLLLLGYGLSRALQAQVRSSRMVAEWLEGAHPLDLGGATPAFQANDSVPPLTLAGVYRPRLLVSESTVNILTKDELQSAVRHEIAHMHARDNLKKLLLRICPFPGMRDLEGAWQEAAELAADDAAVSSASEAVDLAAALIKLSRLVPARPTPAISMGLVQGAVSVRVRRLLAWEKRDAAPRHGSAWYRVAPIVGILLCAAATYSAALTETHRLTEWLVR